MKFFKQKKETVSFGAKCFLKRFKKVSHILESVNINRSASSIGDDFTMVSGFIKPGTYIDGERLKDSIIVFDSQKPYILI